MIKKSKKVLDHLAKRNKDELYAYAKECSDNFFSYLKRDKNIYKSKQVCFSKSKPGSLFLHDKILLETLSEKNLIIKLKQEKNEYTKLLIFSIEGGIFKGSWGKWKTNYISSAWEKTKG